MDEELEEYKEILKDICDLQREREVMGEYPHWPNLWRLVMARAYAKFDWEPRE